MNDYLNTDVGILHDLYNKIFLKIYNFIFKEDGPISNAAYNIFSNIPSNIQIKNRDRYIRNIKTHLTFKNDNQIKLITFEAHEVYNDLSRKMELEKLPSNLLIQKQTIKKNPKKFKRIILQKNNDIEKIYQNKEIKELAVSVQDSIDHLTRIDECASLICEIADRSNAISQNLKKQKVGGDAQIEFYVALLLHLDNLTPFQNAINQLSDIVNSTNENEITFRQLAAIVFSLQLAMNFIDQSLTLKH